MLDEEEEDEGARCREGAGFGGCGCEACDACDASLGASPLALARSASMRLAIEPPPAAAAVVVEVAEAAAVAEAASAAGTESAKRARIS